MENNNADGDNIGDLRQRWQALQRASEEGCVDVGETTNLVATALDALDSLRQQLHIQTDELEVAQKSLEDEYARYLDLFEACPDGYVVTDAMGNIQAMSGIALELLETQLEDVVGTNLADLLVEVEREEFHEIRARILSGQRPENSEWDHTIQTPSGRQLIVSLRTSFSQDQEGNVISMRWLLRDMTEIRHMQNAVTKREAQFRALFENAPLGIALVDLDLQILRSNAELHDFLGVDMGSLPGQSLLALLHAPERSEVEQLLRSLIDGVEERHRTDVRYVHRSGQLVWGTTVMSLAEPDIDHHENGNGEFVIVMVADITEQMEVNAELAEVQRKLLESYEMERLYLAQELHDLPLQELYATDIMVGELRSIVSGAEPLAAIERIRAQIQNINRTLRDLCFELRPPTLASFGLRAAIDAHVQTLRQRHPSLAVHVDLVKEEIVLPQWMGLALYRICQQALNNVVQHSNAENLYLSLSMDATNIEIVIRDDGQGFHVPDRWVTLTRANHLGLAGSAERAAAMGASFSVQSRPGEGTEIRVSAPRPVESTEHGAPDGSSNSRD